MKRFLKFRGFKRAVVLATAIMMVTGGISFAILQSQPAKYTGNTITTATANLLVSADGTNWSNTQSGYAFIDLVPGGQAVPAIGYPVYLRNGGGTPLALKFSVSGTPSNPNNVDLSKVNVILSPVSGGGSPQSFTLQALINASASGGLPIASPVQLMPNLQASQYTLQVSMNADAVNGPGASIGNIDFAFTGLAQ